MTISTPKPIPVWTEQKTAQFCFKNELVEGISCSKQDEKQTLTQFRTCLTLNFPLKNIKISTPDLLCLSSNRLTFNS